MMWRAFVQVLLLGSSLLYLIYLGYFDQVYTQLGLEHYAEAWDLQYVHLPFLPKWLKMPLNTAVNVGYLIVGVYWLVLVSDLVLSNTLTSIDGYVMYVFNWMSVFYGPIQCCRIVTQLHGFAVVDQWVTLPFFAWVVIWAWYIVRGSWDAALATLGVTVSLFSYTLAIFYQHGFEVALGLHITVAVFAGRMAYQKYPNTDSRISIYSAILCCLGFVVLKLLDLQLKRLHWIFGYISGHFISKIFDVLQVHYVNKCFLHIYLTRNQNPQEQKKNEKQKAS